MITTNPFSLLSETIPSIALQAFVLVMVGLVAAGTILDIIHKKNVKYFFNNAKKAKKNATRELGTGERIAIIGKTIVHDIGTTSELGMGKRRIAHVLGMYGTILFWAGSAVMIFCYSSVNAETPIFWPAIWHLGAFMTCIGGFWFWFFLRGSFFQANGMFGWDTLFLVLFAVSNIVLFGGVYWSKFAHMFYKPGAAIQKNLAEADGSRDNLPAPADAPEQFGLGIKRDQPKHY